MKPLSVTFLSGGRKISAEWFSAASTAPRPAVLMLHGRDGPDRFAHAYRAAAQSLVAHNYHVLFVHYFDATQDDSLFGEAGFANFMAWERAVNDAVSWVGSREAADPARMALLGVSLGAAIALAHAATDLRCRAVIEFYGILPPFALAHLRRLPPTLILHGNRDWVVPVAAAYQLEAFLRARNLPYDIHIYHDQGHGFQGAAGADAMRRTIAFLDRYL